MEADREGGGGGNEKQSRGACGVPSREAFGAGDDGSAVGRGCGVLSSVERGEEEEGKEEGGVEEEEEAMPGGWSWEYHFGMTVVVDAGTCGPESVEDA